ncbi:MAG: PIN domain-containing protein [Deltaproteobacteria bacterium]|nr:PIN domain-containing protein [Deltaproteobacteria bacterium]
MIAADTSSIVAYLSGAAGHDVEVVEAALEDRQLCLPPVVLTELLGAPSLPRDVAALLRAVPLLGVDDGHWERVGALRARVLAAGRRARLGDALIAQSCLDHEVRLITRDRDFRHFANAAGLRLLAG